jgi:diguanylate cyclase (GGDEF)-like protein
MRRQVDSQLIDSRYRLLQLAFNDPVLNIKNRASLNMELETELENRNSGVIISVKIINLKTVTEIFGHKYTDRLLQIVSHYIHENISRDLYRFVGNTLMILLKNENAGVAHETAEKIIERFRQPWEMDEQEHFLQVGIGIALYPMSGDTCEEVYRCVSLAMNRAIEFGGDNYAFFAKEFEIPSSVDYYYAMKLRRSVNNGMEGFYIRYQPVCTPDGSIAGCEAFVRYRNGSDYLFASKLVKYAENIGFDVQMDTYVMRKAAEFCRKIQEKYNKPDFFVSVNTTIREMQSDAILPMVQNVLSNCSLAPEHLWVEFSERCFVRPWTEIWSALGNLRKQGVKIAVDNFAEEHAMLTLLRNSCVDAIKMNFNIFSDGYDDFNKIIYKSVREAARHCGVKLCAKFVEHKAQSAIVAKKDVDYVQGYCYGKPLSESEFEERMNSGAVVS